MTNDPRAWDSERARELIAELASLPGALLPILHAIQDEFGYVDEVAVPMMARALNISQAEVHGTISFYHDFRRSRAGDHVLKICRAEACQSMGCEEVIRRVEDRLEVKLGGATADGAFTVEQVFCLGLCATSPAVMLDGTPYGRVSPQVVDVLIDNARRRA
jgi:formate dehydrogenase subunit gamma